ncbi:diguanylate cyclase [Rhizobium sp. Leaf371]|uniref:bifunctional diguanylate cyclase/phosphodiesterase n=1 Tax=Rhizobium sp. Leaf371 TaxID=1736355 RepID=UPI0007151B4C|nr:GGDEF domain-containing protein [Rhizobium sp. Leaf371]KQS59393.1 diguanylate cyclase [Rhizobium sp. Leaf371]
MSALLETFSPRRPGRKPIVPLSKRVMETALQPIVEATTGICFGYESLMRGFDRLGFPSPLALLDRAQETGELLALEHMVIGRALAAFAGLPGVHQRTLFINFDTRLIGVHDEAILDRLDAHLKRIGISPSSLCFELSERHDSETIAAFDTLLDRLRQRGFKLAIDDFGAGYSGLHLLSRATVDYLKIDRHFVSKIESLPRNRQLVKHIVTMAHKLGARVIAEGVETEAEFHICRDLGCDLLQGYFVALPTVCHADLKPSYPHLVQADDTRRRTASADSVLIRRQVEPLPTVQESASLDTIFELFRTSPRQAFFPVVNANNEPRGIIHEYHLKEMIYHPFGRDLLQNKDYQRRVSSFSTPAPVADVNMPAHEMLDIFTGANGSDCLILTENMRYAGVLSSASLLRIISEKQLTFARDQNPLSGLPGNRAIRDHVHEAMLDGDRTRLFCYCDFDNFKPFNDRYGFHRGDAAITLFAALLRRHFIGDGDFVGHVGGDDFFVGLSDVSPDAVADVLTRLLRGFADEVRDLYPEDDRRRGVITGQDRTGTEQTYPLMRCSVGVLVLDEGEILTDINAVTTRVAELKSRAKASRSGLVTDRLA